MLGLLCFDLDGTLADTEALKARSYAWAAGQLAPATDAADLERHYLATCVGHSREWIARGLLERYALEDAARHRAPGAEPWQTYVGLRLERYRAMLADPGAVGRVAVAPVVALARAARQYTRRTALVTTTDRRNADLVLGALGLAGAFDIVVTADDVGAVKPDPESYRQAAARAGVAPSDMLTIEDSPAGIRGALAAGVPVLATPSPHTLAHVDAMVASGEIDRTWTPEDAAREATARATL